MSSCGGSLESKLVGSWTIDGAQYSNLDSISKAKAQEYSLGIQKSIDRVQAELDTTKSEARRRDLRNYKEVFENELSTYTQVNIKSEYEDFLKSMIGKMSFIFSPDGKLTCKVSYPEVEMNTGTWRVSGDTIIALFDNQTQETLIIREISSGSLKVFSPGSGENSEDMTLSLSKN